MKKCISLLTIMFVFLQSCKDDNEISKKCTENYLIIADEIDSGSIGGIRDTLIQPATRNDSAEFLFDINSDGIDDFRFRAFFGSSPCIFISKLGINTINENSKIIINDSIEYPEILGIGDSIQYLSNWKSGIYILYDHHEYCDGYLFDYGAWQNVENSFIGLLVETNNKLFFGWANISIKEYGIFIHQMYSINICKSTQKK